MTRSITFAPEEYYHLYNRGTNKMNIFTAPADYDRFLKLLYICNSSSLGKYTEIETTPGRTWSVARGDSLVDIGAYVLMPNHFHILIRAKKGSDVSSFLQKLLTSYSAYFNKKYDRNGSLFQGKTKAMHASNDSYLQYLYTYIHLNPVKLIDVSWKENGLKDIKKTLTYLNSYPYSSYHEYSDTSRNEKVILNKAVFPAYFISPKEHLTELMSWLSYEEKL